ncbi:LemA family protein [Dehalobacterium formicoaceticum]|uniref:LemA family protein n=1 Tax=Dehalobacterium formicoaceticum TaxID=51515 RepID=A0ABT1Y2V4_9FIRM|nr:LemA family protein [Dehalobacterium formicoaceticum]MCR6544883.1 LemA family protein [Dehalobacterium formicoaceticum]
MGFVIGIGILLVVLAWVITTYNSLIKDREFVRNSMGQISAQIESRWEAIRNMIEGTKQYADYEAKVLEEITEKRTKLGREASVIDVEKDNGLFGQALNQLYAVAENYPDLKASKVYQDTLMNVDKYEQQVRHSRMIFNDTVTKYNRRVQSVPSNIIAGLFNFPVERYFENTPEKADMPGWS